MNTQGHGRDAHDDEHWIGIRAAVGIFVPLMAVAIVGVTVVMMPRSAQTIVADVVRRYLVHMDAVVAVVVQQQPVRERRPHR